MALSVQGGQFVWPQQSLVGDPLGANQQQQLFPTFQPQPAETGFFQQPGMFSPTPQSLQLANILGAFGAATDPQGFAGALFGPAQQITENISFGQGEQARRPTAAPTQQPQQQQQQIVPQPTGQTIQQGQQGQQALAAQQGQPAQQGGANLAALAPLLGGMAAPFSPLGAILAAQLGGLGGIQQAITGALQQPPPQGFTGAAPQQVQPTGAAQAPVAQQQPQGQGGGTQTQAPFLGLLRL